MNEERYIEIFNEFETMLRIGTEISANLAGTFQHEAHLSYADSIYTKLLCHAISLRKLSPQLGIQSEFEIWDLPSACSIARCIIEAHDVLGYIVFSKISPEEREFRLLLWRLHDQQRRSKILVAIKSADTRSDEIHSQANILTNKAIAHSFFLKLPKNLQNKIKAEDSPAFLLSQRELNKANEINQEYHTSTTMWLSQYVHTFPMSLHQLNTFQAGTIEALHLSTLPIQYTLGFFARAITKMAETFCEADIHLNPQEKVLLSKWCFLVKNGVTEVEYPT